MKNIFKISILVGWIILLSTCGKDSIIGTKVSDLLWLEHKGAQMPILVEGNTASKTFILILHGGPGGNAKVYNEVMPAMSNPLEEEYAVAYWDQRLSGNAKGRFSKDDMTVSQMVEDTDKVVDLLRHRYGEDIGIFLLGHSWGGYLGTAYLSTENYQNKIKGWIDVDGAHDIRKLTADGVRLMADVAQQEIARGGGNRGDWESLLDFANDFDSTEIDKDLVLEVNIKAGEGIGYATESNLINESSGGLKTLVNFLFRDHNPLTELVNNFQLSRSQLIEEIIDASLSDDLEKITVPSLLLWGRYDFIVAPSLGEEALEKLGTPDTDKSLVIFEQSGHSPMQTEAGLFVREVVDFIELYK